jgi:predicted metal-dependent peptidase
MAGKRGRKTKETRDIAAENFERGRAMVMRHPIFAPLLYHAHINRSENSICPKGAWAVVTNNGEVHVHPTRRGEPEQWAYVLGHCLLHLGFGHLNRSAGQGVRVRWREWNAACDSVVDDFLGRLKLGRPPDDFLFPLEVSARTEDRIFEELCARGLPDLYPVDMILQPERSMYPAGHKLDWQALFGQGLVAAVTSAVNVAAGVEERLGAGDRYLTTAQQARSWFIGTYPLLGALAASFEIIEDAALCYRLEISVAAVDMWSREIFINPAAGLDPQEMRFVMAHELLHVGLRHDTRCQGRDPDLWNVACDYVINGWLIEMGLGSMPHIGGLYDERLKGQSAEAIYDQIVTDMRFYRRLMTMRGVGISDILQRGRPDWWAQAEGMELDEFYGRALSQGLIYHDESARGLLPAGLIEEIRALSYPPIRWDVELAKWFDEHFAPLEKHRSYARPSRRQSTTPDLPRPRWVPEPGAEDGRTFGVVLDTSGSMQPELLATALGAIASYSIARDVPAVRGVFCDAATYDQGYMPPEDIAGKVKVKGRGGTILQPAIDLLERADDFPKDGPLLIITDGFCDVLRIRREHAFLIPHGRHLPFVPRGKVFVIKG